jgi:hypothetical protein
MRGTSPLSQRWARKPGRGAHITTDLSQGLKAARHDTGKLLRFALCAGPFQNNGATQWFAHVPFGANAQSMKIALDTGSNFIWVTSTLCGPEGCAHHGDAQYNPAKSTSFHWIDQTQKPVSFGPWGTMTVELGEDYLGMPPESTPPSNPIPPYTPFYLASAYSSPQFAQLDWDGGLGLPSGSGYADPNIPPIFASMLNMGLIDPQMPYMSFCTDQKTGTGQALLGGYDENAFEPDSGIFMPWTPYTEYAGVEYIWSTALAQMWVGKERVASNVLFALDSGSSQFKGDDNIMNAILKLVSVPNPPAVSLVLGMHADGTQGKIVVPPSCYNVTIQAGPDQGKTIPQFQPLGLDELVLVGSVLMDHLYTIFEYSVSSLGGEYTLNPKGMWLFNKKHGPKLIKSKSTHAAELRPRIAKQN